ncbi:hypothetical protein FAES_3083 [Fibrella aestuarina BUZ 2]|uniref:Uncharacterized protein n=1 Tax=Fibrella aestuarina BUZ 2 TaxID=1166018 RepID=I0KAD9_9BACT|nr:hypothetical protein [Fibrella aestuarina]CCH01092.1 hypothetical protein FAES_3083 [Fibrella aestuarina BUZ 2]
MNAPTPTPDERHQLTTYLAQLHTLLDAPVGHRDAVDDGRWRAEFAQLITLSHAVLTRAGQMGKRVDFTKGVGVNGKVLDVTSLIDWVYLRLPELANDRPGDLPQNRLNRYVDAGVGFFANGVLFSAEFDDELTYYVDDQRIYLKHHIGRAIAEAERNLG